MSVSSYVPGMSQSEAREAMQRADALEREIIERMTCPEAMHHWVKVYDDAVHVRMESDTMEGWFLWMVRDRYHGNGGTLVRWYR